MEIAYQLVSLSFRQGSPFPVPVLGGYDYYRIIADKHDFQIGTHADWFVSLLSEMSHGSPSPETPDCPGCGPCAFAPIPGIPGIPLRVRSIRGVLGESALPGLTDEGRCVVW